MQNAESLTGIRNDIHSTPPLLPRTQEVELPPETLHVNNYNQGGYSGDTLKSDRIYLADLYNFLQNTLGSQVQTTRIEEGVTTKSEGVVATLKGDIKQLESITVFIGDTCRIEALCGFFIKSLGNNCWLVAYWGKE